MPINVLAFACSPRRGGNSETLLDWVLDTMKKDPDVQVEKIPIVDADVNPCKGCNACEVLNLSYPEGRGMGNVSTIKLLRQISSSLPPQSSAWEYHPRGKH